MAAEEKNTDYRKAVIGRRDFLLDLFAKIVVSKAIVKSNPLSYLFEGITSLPPYTEPTQAENKNKMTVPKGMHDLTKVFLTAELIIDFGKGYEAVPGRLTMKTHSLRDYGIRIGWPQEIVKPINFWNNPYKYIVLKNNEVLTVAANNNSGITYDIHLDRAIIYQKLVAQEMMEERKRQDEKNSSVQNNAKSI